MKAKNSKGIFSALVQVFGYVGSGSWSFMLLLAGACNGHSPRAAIEAAGSEETTTQAQIEAEKKEEPVGSAYRFGDNALDFKLGKSSTAQGRQKTLHLSLGCSGRYTTLNFPTLSN